ncbi:MAG TPA: cytochrome c3 family protein [Sphingobium sp.]|nr:cytochrome c3 family protein [Sphingobium sp.]
MTFLLRTITHRAGGGEIVREARLETNDLRIGRGNDCDVQVPDLAVMLHHARLHRGADGSLEIEALASAGVAVDGAIVSRRRLDPARPARIMLGAHALTVGPEQDGAIPLTLERVAALSDAADVKDEARVFSLAGTRLGKRPLAWTMALLVLGLFLVWPVSAYLMHEAPPAPRSTDAPAARSVWQADAAWSTGPLSSAHASLQNDCAACHEQAFVSVRDETCQSCHTEVHAHAEMDRLRIAGAHEGLKGQARAFLASSFNLPEGRCASCHSEHEGPKGAAASKPSICADCHSGLSTKLEDTPLLDAGDFGRDHPEFRPAIVTTPSFDEPTRQRISLSDQPRENSGLKFPHKLHLSSGNAVARMAQALGKNAGYGAPLDCANCHRPEAGGARFAPIEMEQDCGSCHSLAFSRADGVVRTLRHGKPEQAALELRDFLNLRGPAGATRRVPGDSFLLGRDRHQAAFAGSVDDRVRAIFKPGGVCFDCHVITPPAKAGALAATIQPVSLTRRYMERGWFSHNDHQTKVTPCATCHLAKDSSDARDVLLPGIAVCRDCHTGSHPQKVKVASDCASCHSYHDGSPLPSQRTAARGGQALPPISKWTR